MKAAFRVNGQNLGWMLTIMFILMIGWVLIESFFLNGRSPQPTISKMSSPTLSGKTMGASKVTSAVQQTPEKLTVKQLQIALTRAGFNPGPVDGKLGPRTKRALRDFKINRQLTHDSILDAGTIKMLKAFLNDEEKNNGGL